MPSLLVKGATCAKRTLNNKTVVRLQAFYYKLLFRQS